AWVVAAVAVILTLLALVLPPIFGLALPADAPTSGFTIFYVDDPAARASSLALATSFVSFVLLGAAILRRAPRHRMGWMLLLTGASFATAFAAGAYGAYGSMVVRGLPAADIFLWSSSWSWIPGFTLLIVFVLLFPTGHAVSPRWVPVIWALLVVS